MVERSYPKSKVRGRGRECQADSTGTAERSLPLPRTGEVAGRSHATFKAGAAAGRSIPALEARDSSGEEPPHVQGVVAARAQEGLEELSHVEGQEGQQ